MAPQTDESRRQRERTFADLSRYMDELVERLCQQLGDNLLSRMATDSGPDGRMADPYLVATGVLLLLASHVTTVHLIGIAMLTLLRRPALLARVCSEPDLIPATVQEMLRWRVGLACAANNLVLADAIGHAISTDVLTASEIRGEDTRSNDATSSPPPKTCRLMLSRGNPGSSSRRFIWWRVECADVHKGGLTTHV